MLQVNIISIFVFLYFSMVYRQNDKTRDVGVLDQNDIVNVLMATGICSFLLTPWLSEPLIKLSSDQLVQSNSPTNEFVTTPFVLKSRRKPLQMLLMALSIVLSISLPVWAIAASQKVPASNQYCMSTTLIGSVFGSTLGTNLIYLWINAWLARTAAYAPNKKKASACLCIAHYRAIQIVKDMKAVDEIKDQFTLADVHPSSLESIADGSNGGCGSHHSAASCHLMRSRDNSRNLGSKPHSLAQSCNNIRFPPLGQDKTISEDQPNQAEIIDELQQQEAVAEALARKEQFTEEDE